MFSESGINILKKDFDLLHQIWQSTQIAFLPRDATSERGITTASRPSVRP